MATAAVQGPLVQPSQPTAEDGLHFNNGNVAAPAAWHVDDYTDEESVKREYGAQNGDKNFLGDDAISNNDSRAAKLRDYAFFIMKIDSEVERERAQEAILQEARNCGIAEEICNEVEQYFARRGSLLNVFYDQQGRPRPRLPEDQEEAPIPVDQEGDNVEGSDDRASQTSDNAMQIDQGPVFVSEICDNPTVTDLWRSMLSKAEDPGPADAFSKMVDPQIRDKQVEFRDTQDLGLNTGQIRHIYMYLCNQIVRDGAFPGGIMSGIENPLRNKGYPVGWAQIVREEAVIKTRGLEEPPFTEAQIHQALGQTVPAVRQAVPEVRQRPAPEDIAGLAAELTRATTQNATAGPVSPQPPPISQPAGPAITLPIGEPVMTGLGPSRFPGSVRISTREGYVTDAGAERKIEGWISLGRGNQLLLRMNDESDCPAVCDIVAAGPFGRAVLEGCKRNGRTPQIKGNGDIAFLRDRDPETFNYSMLATQRRDPKRSEWQNHAKQLIGGRFDDDDANGEVRYYYRSTLVRAWGEKTVDENLDVIHRNYRQPPFSKPTKNENALRGVAARGTSEAAEPTTATPPNRRPSQSSVEDSSPTDVAEPQMSESALYALIRRAIAEEMRRTN